MPLLCTASPYKILRNPTAKVNAVIDIFAPMSAEFPHQLAAGTSRLARVSSLLRPEAGPGRSPRPYCRGEQPITLLKAVLKALSDSYPSECAMTESGSLEFVSLSPASNMRQRV